MEQDTDRTRTKHKAPAIPVPELQLVDRAGLHASLKPAMSSATFTNWLQRAMAQHGFPKPIRTGKRTCSWAVTEVAAWLASRPRMGTFDGRRARNTATA